MVKRWNLGPGPAQSSVEKIFHISQKRSNVVTSDQMVVELLLQILLVGYFIYTVAVWPLVVVAYGIQFQTAPLCAYLVQF